MEQVVAYILLPTYQLPGLFLTTYGVPSCLGGFWGLGLRGRQHRSAD